MLYDASGRAIYRNTVIESYMRELAERTLKESFDVCRALAPSRLVDSRGNPFPTLGEHAIGSTVQVKMPMRFRGNA